MPLHGVYQSLVWVLRYRSSYDNYNASVSVTLNIISYSTILLVDSTRVDHYGKKIVAICMQYMQQIIVNRSTVI